MSPLTKTDLQNALKQQNVELGKFLEKKVITPIFDLKKDVSGLKENVSVIKKNVSKLKKDMSYVMHETSNINRKIDASFNRAYRHSEKLDDHEKRIGKLEQISPVTL